MSLSSQQVNVESNKPGWRVYKLKGVDKTIIARKGGPTAEQIKNSPNYKQLRGNQLEFGAASALAKSIRMALIPPLSDVCEAYVSAKLTARLRNLAKSEKGEAGTRSILLSQHGHLLEGFDFNVDYPFEAIFRNKIHAMQSSQKGKLIVHVPGYTPVDNLEFPENATHFKVYHQLCTLSDYVFNEENIIPIHPDFEGKIAVVESRLQPIGKMPIEPMTTQLSIEVEELYPQEVGCVLVSAIRFFKQVSNEFQPLKEGHSMQITKVL